MNTIAIGYLIDNLRLAGTQTALLHLVTGLGKIGYTQQVYYFNDRHQPNNVRNLATAGAEVIHLGAPPAGILRLYTGLRRRPVQILQTFLPASDLIGRVTGRLAGVPRILTSIRARNIDKPGWMLFLDRLTMRWADRVVFNAREVIPFSKQHEGVRADQVVFIPNGVRIPEPRPAIPRQEGAPFVIGTVGRLRPQKDIGTLIEAAAILQKHLSIEVWIIGDGELRSSLENLAESRGLSGRVRFLGARTDLADLYPQMDLYAHASVFEGMPNAVMEAMAAGLPVVATAIDGARELIEDGKTGWLVPVRDPLAMAETIRTALDDLKAAKKAGQEARIKMMTDFSIEKMVARFDRLYHPGTGS